jgi:hypothetical protein
MGASWLDLVKREHEEGIHGMYMGWVAETTKKEFVQA